MSCNCNIEVRKGEGISPIYVWSKKEVFTKKIPCHNELGKSIQFLSQNELLFAYLNLGKFFGEVDGPILNTLAFYKILRKIKIYDYQATCLEQIELSEPTFGSPANGLWTPFKMVTSIFNWIIGKYAIYVYCKFVKLSLSLNL